MRVASWALLLILLLFAVATAAQQEHDHPVPEKLGKVSFSTSCKADLQPAFERAVALLHSFAYSAAQKAFEDVASGDSRCAMAYWGIAMSQFHQLWEPPISTGGLAVGQRAIEQADQLKPGTERERRFIAAVGLVYKDASSIPYSARAAKYESAMREIAVANPKDTEAQVFYALALLANAPPTDKTHSKQKQAAELLQPLYRANPQHPGIAHYLIHSFDNAELAKRGLQAARDYSKIAPSAPHALHMPSHIFTRLGLWDDSIESNLAARKAAREQGDTGEELHAMDYLVYAYLQSGRDQQALEVIQQLRSMLDLKVGEFKIGYAATAMPIRYMVERNQWPEAANIATPKDAPPHIAAIAVWARGMGMARTGKSTEAKREAETLAAFEKQLRASGNEYWATQTGILEREVLAWSAQAEGKTEDAVALLRKAADEEDAIEKLPVTPGPIIPARELLGDLLLEQKHVEAAAKEFARALAESPGRRRALEGARLAGGK